jgi:hypothetical protein
MELQNEPTFSMEVDLEDQLGFIRDLRHIGICVSAIYAQRDNSSWDGTGTTPFLGNTTSSQLLRMPRHE